MRVASFFAWRERDGRVGIRFADGTERYLEPAEARGVGVALAGFPVKVRDRKIEIQEEEQP